MKIGFIGLGLMGESMSLNILTNSDSTLYVYDINIDKVNQLASDGAFPCNSAKEVAKNSEIIITMVPKNEHVIQVYNEMYDEVRTNQLYIDMSTIDPNVSIEISKKIKALGASMIDAPVVKSKPAAINRTLGIYVGGQKQDYERALPILKLMGSNIIHMGGNGTGTTMKLLHNMLVGTIQNGVNEMIYLSEKANINIDDFITAISYGGGQNFYLDGKGKKISERNFETAFSIENMHKDVHLAKDLANSFNCFLPAVDNVVNIYDKAMEKGSNKEDFSASFKVVEENAKK